MERKNSHTPQKKCWKPKQTQDDMLAQLKYVIFNSFLPHWIMEAFTHDCEHNSIKLKSILNICILRPQKCQHSQDNRIIIQPNIFATLNGISLQCCMHRRWLCMYNYLAIEIISKQNDRMFLFFLLLCAFFCSIDSELLQVYLAIYKRLLFTVVFSANVFFIYIFP